MPLRFRRASTTRMISTALIGPSSLSGSVLYQQMRRLDQHPHRRTNIRPAHGHCAVAISASLPWPQYDQSDARWQQVVFKPLALGLIPSLEIGFYQQTLFRQDYICLTGPHHPRIDAALSLAHDQTEGHIGIISGTGQQLLEEAVKRFGIERRVILLLPGFLGLTGVLAACDLIVTLPRRIGETLAVLGGLKAHACPFPIPRFSVKQHWHARYHHDMANRWLRGSCAGLFLRS